VGWGGWGERGLVSCAKKNACHPPVSLFPTVPPRSTLLFNNHSPMCRPPSPLAAPSAAGGAGGWPFAGVSTGRCLFFPRGSPRSGGFRGELCQEDGLGLCVWWRASDWALRPHNSARFCSVRSRAFFFSTRTFHTPKKNNGDGRRFGRCLRRVGRPYSLSLSLSLLLRRSLLLHTKR